MSGYLLDTNVISEIAKPTCNPNVRRFVTGLEGTPLFVSALTVGEIRKGISRLKSTDDRKMRLEQWLADLKITYGDNVLPVDVAVAELWGHLSAEAAARGHTLSTVDALIACTALNRGLKVISRNVKHLSAAGAEVIDPWCDLQTGPLRGTLERKEH